MLDDVKNTLSLFSKGLLGRLRQDCKKEWDAFIFHPFVKDLAKGILPKEIFKNFLIQDYLYLLEYCRVEALAIYKSNQFSEMQHFSTLLKGLLEVELPLHLTYCQQWGIEKETLQSETKSLELIAYSQYLLNKTMQGDLLDAVILLLPCLIGYGEIGLNLLLDMETVQVNNPYFPWIEVYGGSQYHLLVKNSLQFLEQIAVRYGAEQRYSMLLNEFKTVVQLETAFWNVGQSNNYIYL